MARTVYAGEPGDVFTNDTGKVQWQFICSLHNTCGLCLQFHHQVGPYWPIPLHRGCNCQQHPILPDESAKPYVDFQDVISRLDSDQRRRVIGRSAWKLVESGVVKYEDVVTRARVRTFREVVSNERLSIDRLLKAGVSEVEARKAYESVHTEVHAASEATKKRLIDALALKGVKADSIVKAVTSRVAVRVGIAGGPSGPGYPGVKAFTPRGPRPKPTPKPTPTAPVIPPTPSRAFPDHPNDDVEVVRRLGGSTGAELVKDRQTGKLFVRKRGSSADHLREEDHADSIYREFGVAVPESRLYRTPQGPVKLAEYHEGTTLAELRRSNPTLAMVAEAKVREHFAVDALVANWDVIGLEADNILVTKAGDVFRIDNGGALRFRAQGARKSPEQFDAYPTDLWTLRDPRVNAQSAKVFGKLTATDLAKQIEKLDHSALSDLPEPLKSTLVARLDQLKDVARTTNTFVGDEFKDGYADRIGKHTIGIRKAGISDRFPEKFERPYSGSVEVVDPSGKPWDHLRGPGSVVEGLERYIGDAGGDYEIATRWMSDQAISSWSDASQALKYHINENRGRPADGYYWQDGIASAKEAYGREIARVGEEKYEATFSALHAFTREYLTRIDFTKKHADTGTIRLTRTEHREVLEASGLKRGDKGVTMKRGVAESTSLFTPVMVGGSEITVQNVPIHRIVATYWQERKPGSGRTAFLGDHENEFIAILDEIPFDYGKERP